MITPKKASPSGKKQVPGWLRFLLVLLPICVCLPLTGAAVVVVVRQVNGQAATATAAGQQTQSAAETAGSRERLQATSQAATEVSGTLQAAVQATATALAATVPTATLQPSPTVPAASATPNELFTLTLIECRGNDGVVILDGAPGQTLAAFTTISFKVARGSHNLEIVWAEDPDNNVETQIDVQRDTALVYGDPCT